jgi:hypothetical protein
MPGLHFGGIQFTKYCIKIMLVDFITKAGGEDIAACLLKARIVSQQREPLLGNSSSNMPITRQWLSSCHVIAATDMQ